MDWSAARHGLNLVLLLLGAAFTAGCSGSGSSTGHGGDPSPPVEQPPADDDSPAEPPPEEPGDPAAEPTLSFSAGASVVASGESVVLTWSSEGATSCSASGGWSGSRSVQGSATVGPIEESTTFTLSCSGSGGNTMDMLSVGVLGLVALEWEPPTENADGSPLADLAGYRIYYGEISGTYTEELSVSESSQTAQELTLPSGSYYFAMTALDADGNESGYSNEVVKIVD